MYRNQRLSYHNEGRRYNRGRDYQNHYRGRNTYGYYHQNRAYGNKRNTYRNGYKKPKNNFRNAQENTKATDGKYYLEEEELESKEEESWNGVPYQDRLEYLESWNEPNKRSVNMVQRK